MCILCSKILYCSFLQIREKNFKIQSFSFINKYTRVLKLKIKLFMIRKLSFFLIFKNLKLLYRAEELKSFIIHATFEYYL